MVVKRQELLFLVSCRRLPSIYLNKVSSKYSLYKHVSGFCNYFYYIHFLVYLLRLKVCLVTCFVKESSLFYSRCVMHYFSTTLEMYLVYKTNYTNIIIMYGFSAVKPTSRFIFWFVKKVNVNSVLTPETEV